MKRTVLIACLFFVATSAHAEYLEIRQNVFGMDWAVCAHAVSVAFKKVDGVRDVDVSLNEGTATLKLKPGNKITVEQVREIIRKNGFTAKETRVRVRGKIVERSGKPALDVSGLDQVLLLDGPKEKLALAELRKGKELVLVGMVSEPKENTPDTLTIEQLEDGGS